MVQVVNKKKDKVRNAREANKKATAEREERTKGFANRQQTFFIPGVDKPVSKAEARPGGVPTEAVKQSRAFLKEQEQIKAGLRGAGALQPGEILTPQLAAETRQERTNIQETLAEAEASRTQETQQFQEGLQGETVTVIDDAGVPIEVPVSLLPPEALEQNARSEGRVPFNELPNYQQLLLQAAATGNPASVGLATMQEVNSAITAQKAAQNSFFKKGIGKVGESFKGLFELAKRNPIRAAGILGAGALAIGSGQIQKVLGADPGRIADDAQQGMNTLRELLKDTETELAAGNLELDDALLRLAELERMANQAREKSRIYAGRTIGGRFFDQTLDLEADIFEYEQKLKATKIAVDRIAREQVFRNIAKAHVF